MYLVCGDILKKQTVPNIEDNEEKWEPSSSFNDAG